ncbi:hypothetical protein Golomagni_08393, partial [Golovinomyces magnicellulatus]
REIAKKGDAFKWSHEATLVTRYRRFGTTAIGYYLVGPDSMLEGDAVVLLYGGRTPFLLRRRKDDDGWNVIGECYVHGMMKGEGMATLYPFNAYSTDLLSGESQYQDRGLSVLPPLHLLQLRLTSMLDLDGMDRGDRSLIVLPTVENRSNLLQRQALGLHEKEVDDDQDEQGKDDGDDVVPPANVLETDGVDVVDGKGGHGKTEEHPGK